MNNLIHEKRNHSENCITVEVSRTTQKFENYLSNERSGYGFFSKDLGQTFGTNVGKESEVMLIRKGPHKPELAYYNVRIHSLMTYTDLTENIVLSNTNAPLLRCFLFVSKLKA